jgi:MinD-like ATPase involved in chromosome partitioning or flagellar assembly
VIIAVGSGKGSPGATTFAVLLAMAWPGERVLCELDPAGADLPYRLLGADRRPLAASPSIATLAVESRPGALAQSLLIYAQPTSVGVSVIAGEGSPARFARLAQHLPSISSALASWPGTVIADLGMLINGNPVLPLAREATVTVLVTRSDVTGLAHLRDQVEELSGQMGGAHRLRVPLAVVVRASRRDATAALGRVAALLESIGSPVPVIGAAPDDDALVSQLSSAALSRRTVRGPGIEAAHAVIARLRSMWPELTESTGHASIDVDATDRAAALR